MSAGLVLDDLIDIFKLSTLLLPSINLSDIMKIPWELWELNPGLLGEKRECYLCAMQPPSPISSNFSLPETILTGDSH